MPSPPTIIITTTIETPAPLSTAEAGYLCGIVQACLMATMPMAREIERFNLRIEAHVLNDTGMHTVFITPMVSGS